MTTRTDTVRLHADESTLIEMAAALDFWHACRIGEFEWPVLLMSFKGNCLPAFDAPDWMVPDRADLFEAIVKELENLPLHRHDDIQPVFMLNGTKSTILADWNELAEACDFYSRMLCGQFGELVHVCGVADLHDTWRVKDMAVDIRCQYTDVPVLKSPAVTGVSIMGASDSAKRAYNVWKVLGGGVKDWGTVLVDGFFCEIVEED